MHKNMRMFRPHHHFILPSALLITAVAYSKYLLTPRISTTLSLNRILINIALRNLLNLVSIDTPLLNSILSNPLHILINITLHNILYRLLSIDIPLLNIGTNISQSSHNALSLILIGEVAGNMIFHT
jgi:uncharacterized membrane protein YkvI